MSMETIVANLVEKIESRYYGKYRGFVIENADPEKLGRLKLRVPSLLGDEVVTGWAMPCVPYGGDKDQGMLFIPEVGAGVWVEFEEGDLEFPIWVGTFWSKPDGNSELPFPNKNDSEDSTVQSPPTRKTIKTKKGHTIQFEDSDDELHIIISDGQGENYIVFSSNGISIVNKNQKENSITLTQEGITISDTNSNTFTMNASSGTFGNGISINGGQAVCLAGLVDWLKNHTHIPQTGLLNPADRAALELKLNLPGGGILSEKVKVG